MYDDPTMTEAKMENGESNAWFDPSFDYQMGFLKDIYGGAIVPKWTNGKRYSIERESLTQECCIKGCSHNEILGYCDGKGGYLGFPVDR